MPSTEARTVRTDSPDATRALAERLGAVCAGEEVLLLDGPLGAGKTAFVQGLARGLGVPPQLPVTSPTFVLHAEYAGRLLLHHLDAYRLEDAPDVTGLGFEEILGAPGTVGAVEWPAFLAPLLPADRLGIEIRIEGDTARALRFTPTGPRHAALLERCEALP